MMRNPPILALSQEIRIYWYKEIRKRDVHVTKEIFHWASQTVLSCTSTCHWSHVLEGSFKWQHFTNRPTDHVLEGSFKWQHFTNCPTDQVLEGSFKWQHFTNRPTDHVLEGSFKWQHFTNRSTDHVLEGSFKWQHFTHRPTDYVLEGSFKWQHFTNRPTDHVLEGSFQWQHFTNRPTDHVLEGSFKRQHFTNRPTDPVLTHVYLSLFQLLGVYNVIMLVSSEKIWHINVYHYLIIYCTEQDTRLTYKWRAPRTLAYQIQPPTHTVEQYSERQDTCQNNKHCTHVRITNNVHMSE